LIKRLFKRSNQLVRRPAFERFIDSFTAQFAPLIGTVSNAAKACWFSVVGKVA
jgi:hypothetical protein